MKTRFSKMMTKTVSICISLMLVFALIPTNAFAYSTSELKSHTAVSSIEVGDPDGSDYIKLTTTGSNIEVVFQHSEAFDRIVLRLMKDGSNYKKDAYHSVQTGANERFQQYYDFSGIPNGEYYFRIVTQSAAQKAAGLQEYSTYFQGALVSVKSGVPTLQKYKYIVANNTEKTKSSNYKAFTQTSLEDYKYQLFSKKGAPKEYRTINATTEAKYYKKISDAVVKGQKTNYGKLKSIYTYVAKNFYYDHYGVSKGNAGFDDPYNNLKYLNDKSGNKYNAYSGKVAVQCDGYAGIFTALTRAQGIPCRIVYGRKITSGTDTWEGQSKITSKNHTWAEAWVDDRWITIDPQQGSYNSYSTAKKWLKTAFVNYTFFDVSADAFAYTHCTSEIVAGSKTSSQFTASNEVSQLKTFLNTKSSGKTNGARLNSAYSSSKKDTWGTSKTLKTDGKGRVSYINWPEKNLSGKFNLSGFTSLKNLTVYKNKLTSLNTTNCKSLETVAASGNKITQVNLSAAKSLKKADYSSNPLTSAKIYTNSKIVSISTVKSGTFGFKYADKKITIYPKANPGYKYLGVYNADGKRLTSKTTYTFKPTGKTYKVKFALNPASFKYTLKPGSKTSLQPYNLAVEKRLKELKYFKNTPNGTFDKATTTAVKAFQKKNGLKQTGIVNQATWKKLFSTKAKKK